MNSGVPWRFDAVNPWVRVVPMNKIPEKTADLCDVVVPKLAAGGQDRPALPCVVTARITLQPDGRRVPFGPKGRAKAVLDALHDQRKVGVKYEALGAVPPLPDDDPNFVRGYGLEVQSGSTTGIEYRIGSALVLQNSQLLSSLDVHASAPNDVGPQALMLAALDRFAKVLGNEVWSPSVPVSCSPLALVIRHRPERDEDNTWMNWIAALVQPRYQRHRTWPMLYPVGWNPPSVATIADADLTVPTRYELYG